MKVFEVTTERLAKDSNKIETSVQYVTADGDSLSLVARYFAKHCYEYEEELRGVRDVISIVQHIKEAKQ